MIGNGLIIIIFSLFVELCCYTARPSPTTPMYFNSIMFDGRFANRPQEYTTWISVEKNIGRKVEKSQISEERPTETQHMNIQDSQERPVENQQMKIPVSENGPTQDHTTKSSETESRMTVVHNMVHTTPIRTIGTSFNKFDKVPRELLIYLFRAYSDTANDDESTMSLRRFRKQNKEFEVHVKKLKEVNGYKRHNLMLKEIGDNPVIYINNPVEARITNAYLTLEEFKNILEMRASDKRGNSKLPTTVTARKGTGNIYKKKSFRVSRKVKSNQTITTEGVTKAPIQNTSPQINTLNFVTKEFKTTVPRIVLNLPTVTVVSTEFGIKNITSQIDIMNVSSKEFKTNEDLVTNVTTVAYASIKLNNITTEAVVNQETVTTESYETNIPDGVGESTVTESIQSDIIEPTTKASVQDETKINMFHLKNRKKKFKRTRTSESKSTKIKRSTLGRPQVFIGS